MIFLITTADQRFWEIDNPVLFLGEWCKLYSKKPDWEKISHKVMPYPWDNREIMHKAIQYEDEFYEEALELLSQFLNNVHNRSYSIRYWGILIGPWLRYYIQVLHEKYNCLKHAFENYSDMKTIGLAESSFKIPRNMFDFNIGCSGDIYNLQLYTILLDKMGYKFPKYNIQWEFYEESKDTSSVIKKLYKKAKEKINNAVIKWAKSGEILITNTNFPFYYIAKIIIKSGFRVRWSHISELESSFNTILDSALHPNRQELVGLATSNMDSFKTIFFQTLPYNFPLAYLEEYKVHNTRSIRYAANTNIKKIITQTGAIPNEAFKFTAALLTEKGTKLIIYQHGGGYGSTKYYPNEIIERSIVDEYWTWGWGEQDDKISAMPHPVLSSIHLIKNIKKERNTILYIGNGNLRYRLTNISSPMGNQIKDYISWQIRFFKALDDRPLNQIKFRPYYHQWPEDDPLRPIQDSVNHLQIEREIRTRNPLGKFNDIYYELNRSDLIICDMNQTTFLESLVLNVPTIIFWNSKFEEIRHKASSYFTELREAGILYDSPEKAGKKVNEIFENPWGWWNQYNIQTAKDRFCYQFARTSDNWLEEWNKRLLD